MFLTQFQNVGRALSNRGLVSSASGNLSIRMGDHLIITRRGSNLGGLFKKKTLLKQASPKTTGLPPWRQLNFPSTGPSISIPRLEQLFTLIRSMS
jgi:hypothetical protein